jgi:transposase-like protein
MSKAESPHRLPATLMEAIRFFSDLDVANDFVAAIRWPEGPSCPTCGGRDLGYIKSRRLWQCKTKGCRKQFSVKVGTIFEDSPIPLDKWVTSVWLIANSKNGISSHELARSIGLTQKSAWFVLQRVRLAMREGTFDLLSGEVEADETFIGGAARFMHARDRAVRFRGGPGPQYDKAKVFGVLQRDGRVRAEVIEDTTKRTLHGKVRANVQPGAKLYTDESTSYSGLDQDFAHETVNHAEEYVRGRVHTNGLENFWSLLKRGLRGTYISVEPFHLFRYIDEQVFRFNQRKLRDFERFGMVLHAVSGRRLTYAALTGKL